MQRKLAHVMTALAATSLAGCVSVNGNLSSSSAANEGTDDGDTACESGECTAGTTGSTPTTDGPPTTDGTSTTDGEPASGTSSGTAGTSDTDDGGTSSGGSSTGATTGSEDELEGWAMRRAIVIENVMPEDLVDFQVEVRLEHDDDMQVEFGDLRFTEADGTSLLPHWLERFSPLVDADVWVRVPLIPASGTVELWMYYGNPAAEDGSDGDATMLFMDDFNGNSLDPVKWSATSDHDVVSGRLDVHTGAVYSNDAVVEVGQVLQARVQWTCCEPAPLIPTLTTALGQGDALFGDFLRFLTPYLQIQGSANMDIFPDMLTTMDGSGGPWHDVGLAREFGLAHFRRFSGLTTNSYVVMMPGAHYIILGEEQGATATNQGMGDFWVDHVFVRSFALIDPTSTVGEEEMAP